MSLRLLSYLASLGFRADLDTPQTPVLDRDDAQTAAATDASDGDDTSNLKFVLAL